MSAVPSTCGPTVNDAAAAADTHDVRIVDVPERERYELFFDGALAGVATYRRSPGRITFIHTEIVDDYEGHGLGGRLAAHVLDEARAHGETVRPLCPFIAAFIEKHPDYADLVTPTRS